MAGGERELKAGILKAVSRSFYLTLRLLPRGMRAPASLGYLLARLSDTIADAGELETAKRRELLERYREVVAGRGDRESGSALAEDLRGELAGAGLTPGEAALARRAPDCLAWLERLDDTMAGHVREVVGTITDGQLWDLQRFAGDGVVRLEKPEELDLYTYRVAGCVGEFWTEIGFAGCGRFSRMGREELREWGARYGKGLQLVNILRDLPGDLRRGRCYLPGKGEVSGEELCGLARPWIESAREGMAAGRRYANSLRGTRLQMATGLPALLGERTLDLLENAGWEELEAGVKISRRQVRREMGRALRFSVGWLPGRWV